MLGVKLIGLLAIGAAFAADVSLGQTQQKQPLQRFEYVHPAMGVKFKIVLYAPGRDLATRAIKKSVAQIDCLDLLLSDYKSSSEIRRLCASAPHREWQQVSSDLFQILKISQSVNQQTDGAFDVTVGNISKLWRQARKTKKMPQPRKLKLALASVGMEQITFGQNSSVKLTRKNVRVDFGAIAKGYAADRVIKILKEHGVRSALIDASGDIVVSEPPPGRDGWKIEVFGIEKSKRHFIQLKNRAIATSGDLYQYVKLDGKRYSHIVNPKTGIGVSGPMSVTVIAPNGSIADAMASAISVRFEVDRFKVLEKHSDIQSCVVRFPSGLNQPQISRTRGFPELETID